MLPFRVRLTGSSSGTLEAVVVQAELVDYAIPGAGWAIGGKEFWFEGANTEDPAGIFDIAGARLTTWLPADDTSDESESLTFVKGDGQGNLFWFYHYANDDTDYWYRGYVAKTDSAGTVAWLTRLTAPLLGGADPPADVSHLAPLTDGGCQIMSAESIIGGDDLFNVRVSPAGAIGTPYSRPGTTPQGDMVQVGSEVWFAGHSAGSGLLSRFDLDGQLVSYEDAAPWAGIPNMASWSGSRLAVATTPGGSPASDAGLWMTDGAGSLQWSVLADGCRRAWFVGDDVVAGFLSGSQWTVQRRSGADGSQVWSTDMPGPVECSVGTAGVVAVADGDVFLLASGSGAVLSQNGHDAGTVPTTGSRGRIVAL